MPVVGDAAGAVIRGGCEIYRNHKIRGSGHDTWILRNLHIPGGHGFPGMACKDAGLVHLWKRIILARADPIYRITKKTKVEDIPEWVLSMPPGSVYHISLR
jgi:hypothetical protein